MPARFPPGGPRTRGTAEEASAEGLHYRNRGLHPHFTRRKFTVASEQSWARPIHLGFRDDVCERHPGETLEFAM